LTCKWPGIRKVVKRKLAFLGVKRVNQFWNPLMKEFKSIANKPDYFLEKEFETMSLKATLQYRSKSISNSMRVCSEIIYCLAGL